MDKSDDELLSVIKAAINDKPQRHAFSISEIDHGETRTMSQIGG